MKQISINTVSNLKKFSSQGGSWSVLYTGTYAGKSVIVKAQAPGSLAKTDPLDDKFLKEKEAFDYEIPGIVHCFGWGDDFEGERFIVLERLKNIPSKITPQKMQEIANTIFLVARQLYLRGINWCATPKHVMLDQHNTPKIIDFNDDYQERASFLTMVPGYNYKDTVIQLCKLANVESSVVLKNAFDNLVREEYASLENVHQPIYFQRYADYLRRETETNDKAYNKLVPPN